MYLYLNKFTLKKYENYLNLNKVKFYTPHYTKIS